MYSSRLFVFSAGWFGLCPSLQNFQKSFFALNTDTKLDGLGYQLLPCAFYILAFLFSVVPSELIAVHPQTEQSRRQDMVVSFKQKSCPQRIFLLSSKAGGVGLNLTGANRLLIFDVRTSIKYHRTVMSSNIMQIISLTGIQQWTIKSWLGSGEWDNANLFSFTGEQRASSFSLNAYIYTHIYSIY